MMQPKPEKCIPTNQIEWDTCERHVGALLLRGNRCVLVRSTHESEYQWTGMRVSSVLQKSDETPVQAAIRAVA